MFYRKECYGHIIIKIIIDVIASLFHLKSRIKKYYKKKKFSNMDYCYVLVWAYYIKIYSSRYTAHWNILLFNGEDLSLYVLFNKQYFKKKKKCLFSLNTMLTMPN